jgi:peptide/nickel transport system permease protein
VVPPESITGSYLIDGIIAGRWDVVRSAASHLILPVLTFVLLIAAPVMKMMRASMAQILDADFIHYARMIGLPPKKIRGYAFRNALPPVITLVGIYSGVMIGGAVLIETVFGLGGLGQYAVQSASLSDYNALTGFVILACIITLIILLVVDLLIAAVDPRIRY